ncbi:hypothetical protein AURDEDRAFT_114512 [Auricularia subglabra TFB-10046 SS5]|nr:hypothetical protein AURDEDRAFT_114512 [Auricularia subglabra TFB-10046 SS5]
MPVARKGSNPVPVPSRTNTATARVPQLGRDALDPFARHNRPIPPQFADNVQYEAPTPKGSPKTGAKLLPSDAQLPAQSSKARPPGSPSKKSKTKKKASQKSSLPAELVHARPRTNKPKSSGSRWPIELWVLSFFAIYILAVCPSDSRLEHPICRALDSYQTYIPYSYLRYKLDNALEHPYVAPVVHQTAPYYHKAVHASTPLVNQVQTQWKRHVVPTVSRTVTRMERWATPYALAAADAWHLRVDPYTYRLGRALRPYRRQAEKYTLITIRRMYLAWRAAEPRLTAAWDALMTIPPMVLKPALAAWEEFVDPPVRKMWARVEELAAGKGKTQRRKPQPTFGAYAQPVEDNCDEDDVEEIAVEAVDAPPAAPASQPPPPVASPVNVDDVDSFLAELLNDAGDEAESPEPAQEPEPEPSVSEEELARQRRLANIEKAKDKRAKFEEDFKEWQDKLEKTIEEQTEELIKTLEEERLEVYRAFTGKESRLVSDVKALEDELTLALKSMSAYLEKITKEADRKELPQLWSKLVDKVHAKVENRIHATENVVEELWQGVQNLEQGIINRAHEPIYFVSENAQAQLGMPLAWLEDVTPADWKRFHDMKERVKTVRQTFVDMQEGEHARSPADPIVALFKRTQADVQDILAGFEVQFNEIRRRGEASFKQPQTADPPSETIIPLIGRGKEEVEHALRHEEL